MTNGTGQRVQAYYCSSKRRLAFSPDGRYVLFKHGWPFDYPYTYSDPDVWPGQLRSAAVTSSLRCLK